jgi:putative molybdopterin biosynthesis protein
VLADGVCGVGKRGLRLVNREPDAEARFVLDRELAGLRIEDALLPGSTPRRPGHLQVAAAIVAGLAEAGSRASRRPLPMAWLSSR